ncbi:hypothetical protein HPP92_025810 [Vanilla planifolia]|uniref:Uncharacterized protein n=1 Tax=Vanilla planifolia TaxID=51239 RepID=A0A835UBD9_VANPL|nr:hypothetical protein HPP92_025810 [Vanilla planifolia]
MLPGDWVLNQAEICALRTAIRDGRDEGKIIHSHEKGCRSYICDTSYRHSNCLDQFKKSRVSHGDSSSLSSSSIAENLSSDPNEFFTEIADPIEENGGRQHDTVAAIRADGNDVSKRSELRSLKCPLCRGNVLGWMVVKEARQYLDLKTRICSRESCSFSGNYRELRRHARRVHPSTRPVDIDPSRQRAWRRLEDQREYGDILSAVRSAMPGAIVFGDYVIESGSEALPRDREFGERGGQWLSTLFLFHMFRNSSRGSLDEPRGTTRSWRTRQRSRGQRNLWGENLLGLQDDDDEDDDLNPDDDIMVPRRRRRFTRPRRDDEQQ